jgi:ABC-type antimicrobial peptide transport system permease subunit
VAAITAVRRELEALDKELPLTGVKTFSEHLGVALVPAQVAATVLSAFGLLAPLLAATGLYGVIACVLTQRTREIGVRVVLGARRADVLMMVLRQGMALTAAGIAIGAAGAWGVTRVLAAMLYGVSPTDPLTFAGVAAGLALIALAACAGPARRASKVDPMVALRWE